MTASAVQLYRYDLTNGMAAQFSQSMLGTRIEAIWHTAIVAFGCEYYFDGGVGISCETPGATRFGRPLRVDQLGRTTKSKVQFDEWVRTIGREKYGPNDYSLLQRNCNHFSQDASMFLLNIGIGEDVRHMIDRLLSTPLGMMVRPMLEAMTHSGAMGGGGSVRPPHAADHGLRSKRLQLSTDEQEELQIALALLQSSVDETSPLLVTKFVSSMKTLCSILNKIIDNPSEIKFRNIKRSSETFQNKVLASNPDLYLDPIHTILSVSGFASASEGYSLSDESGSRAVLCQVRDQLVYATTLYDESGAPRTVAIVEEEIGSSQPSKLAESMKDAEDVSVTVGAAKAVPEVRYISLEELSHPHINQQWALIPVGAEGGKALYSIRVNGTFLGKGAFDVAEGSGQRVVFNGGHFLNCNTTVFETADGVMSFATDASLRTLFESSIPKDYRRAQEGHSIASVEVLCVQSSEPLHHHRLRWVPCHALGLVLSDDSGMCPLVGFGGMFVARATHCGNVHPGVAWPRGGRHWNEPQAVISYGGRAVDVTSSAEVLCYSDLLSPAALAAVERAQMGEARFLDRRRQLGMAPIASIDELLSWMPPPPLSDGIRCRPVNTVKRRSPGDDGMKLLVCHDYKGGYRSADTALFSAADSDPEGLLNDAYTVEYWQHVDVFVYFSHHRVSVPPRDWVIDAHNHRVPILGTFITEWEEGQQEWNAILTNPQRMAAVIRQLVALAQNFGFDGYLLNVENNIAGAHVKRLQAFVAMLRKTLKDEIGSHAQVVWYDAVNSDGRLNFQNNLTLKNKPYFDASDSIFLNYFWRPETLTNSVPLVGAARAKDVLVGVDCFGRSQYGGGGFHCDVALSAIESSQQSVALFAPAWTLENAASGSRSGFEAADATFWSKLSPRFFKSVPTSSWGEGESLRFMTNFSCGVGRSFSCEGTRVSAGMWIQRGGALPRAALAGFRGPLQQEDGDSKGATEIIALTGSSLSPSGDVMKELDFGCASALVRRGNESAFHGDTTILVRASPMHREALINGLLVEVLRFDSNASSGNNAVQFCIAWRHVARGTPEFVSPRVVLRITYESQKECKLVTLDADKTTSSRNGWMTSTFLFSPTSQFSCNALLLRLDSAVNEIELGWMAAYDHTVAQHGTQDILESEPMCTATLQRGVSADRALLSIAWHASPPPFNRPVTVLAGVMSSGEHAPRLVYCGEYVFDKGNTECSTAVELVSARDISDVLFVEVIDAMTLSKQRFTCRTVL